MHLFRIGKINFRLTVVMIFLCLIVIVTLSIYFENYYSNMLSEKTVISNTQIINILDNVISDEIDKIRYLANTIMIDELIQSVLSQQNLQVFLRKDIIALNTKIGQMYAISDLVKNGTINQSISSLDSPLDLVEHPEQVFQFVDDSNTVYAELVASGDEIVITEDGLFSGWSSRGGYRDGSYTIFDVDTDFDETKLVPAIAVINIVKNMIQY